MIGWLFDTSMGPPGPAGHWPLWLGIAFHASNLVIGIGQLSIPLMFVASWKYRRDGVKARELWSVLAFVPAMALSRLVRVVEIWGPPYHLTTILDVITAVLTVYGAFRIVRLVRDVMKLPSRAEHHAIRNALQAALLREQVLRLDVAAERDAVLLQLDEAREFIKNEAWKQDTRNALDAMSRAAAMLRKGGGINGN